MSVDVFFAIADPTRRAVLGLLARGRRNAGEIAASFPRLTQPAVSRHLKVLREAGLVNVEVNAQQRIYELNPEGMMELHAWVAKYQKLDTQALDSLERHLDAQAFAKRKGKK